MSKTKTKELRRRRRRRKWWWKLRRRNKQTQSFSGNLNIEMSIWRQKGNNNSPPSPQKKEKWENYNEMKCIKLYDIKLPKIANKSKKKKRADHPWWTWQRRFLPPQQLAISNRLSSNDITESIRIITLMNAIAHLGLGRRNGDMATLPFIPKRNNSTRNYVKQLAVEKN